MISPVGPTEPATTTGDFKLPAYRAMPAGGSRLPVVLVVSEIFGVHEHIADVTIRFAKLGYLAIAPELFARQGDPASYGEVAKLMPPINTPTDQLVAGLDRLGSALRSMSS